MIYAKKKQSLSMPGKVRLLQSNAPLINQPFAMTNWPTSCEGKGRLAGKGGEIITWIFFWEKGEETALGHFGSRGEIVYFLKYEYLTLLSQIHSGITVCEEVTYPGDWVMMTFRKHCAHSLSFWMRGWQHDGSTLFHTFSWKLNPACLHLSEAVMKI